MSWVTAGAPAPLPGYARVVCKRHVVGPYELDGTERAASWEDVLETAEAVASIVRPAKKLNHEIHGNTLPHLHAHVYSRFPGDSFEGGPIDGGSRTYAWSEDQPESLRERLAGG